MTFRFQSWILRTDLWANPDVLYVFGDNMLRKGLGGQAKEMRGEPNAIGVRTKKAPSMSPDAFLSDVEYEMNKTMITNDLIPVWGQLQRGRDVVFPMDGLGTGLSNLVNVAPRTAEYLEARISDIAATFGNGIKRTRN